MPCFMRSCPGWNRGFVASNSADVGGMGRAMIWEMGDSSHCRFLGVAANAKICPSSFAKEPPLQLLEGEERAREDLTVDSTLPSPPAFSLHAVFGVVDSAAISAHRRKEGWRLLWTEMLRG